MRRASAITHAAVTPRPPPAATTTGRAPRAAAAGGVASPRSGSVASVTRSARGGEPDLQLAPALEQLGDDGVGERRRGTTASLEIDRLDRRTGPLPGRGLRDAGDPGQPGAIAPRTAEVPSGVVHGDENAAAPGERAGDLARRAERRCAPPCPAASAVPSPPRPARTMTASASGGRLVDQRRARAQTIGQCPPHPVAIADDVDLPAGGESRESEPRGRGRDGFHREPPQKHPCCLKLRGRCSGVRSHPRACALLDGRRRPLPEVRENVAERAQRAHRRGVDLGVPGNTLLQRREDLDPLDRVDAQVGLEPHLQRQQLRRVAGLLRDHPEQQRLEIDDTGGRGRRRAWHARRRCVRRRRRSRSARETDAFEPGDDVAERAHLGQGRRFELRKVGQALLQPGENLDTLDRVDAEVGLQRHLRAQQIDGVAGLLRDDREERAENPGGRDARGGGVARRGGPARYSGVRQGEGPQRRNLAARAETRRRLRPGSAPARTGNARSAAGNPAACASAAHERSTDCRKATCVRVVDSCHAACASAVSRCSSRYAASQAPLSPSGAAAARRASAGPAPPTPRSVAAGPRHRRPGDTACRSSCRRCRSPPPAGAAPGGPAAAGTSPRAAPGASRDRPRRAARGPGGTPWRRPRPRASRLIARCGRPARIFPTSPVSTAPGPSSRNVRAPPAYIASTCSTKSTGRASCVASSRRIASGSPGYGAASALEYTGTAAGSNGIAARNPSKAPAESATSGEWKAVATGRRSAGSPSARSCSSKRSTASVGPETTTWSGALWFANTTRGAARAARGPVRREPAPPSSRPARGRRPPSAPRAAARPAGTSGRRTPRPRAAPRPRRRSARRRTPGARPRPRAGSAGRAPRRRAPVAPTASAAAAILLPGPLLVGERRRREDDLLESRAAPRPAGRPRGPTPPGRPASAAREPAPIPVYWLPCPANR